MILQARGISITSGIEEIHGNNDPETFLDEIRRAREMGDSVGAVIRIRITGCPPGLGDPVFGKLDALLTSALMGIGGVKGIEIGEGFNASRMYGSEHNDAMTPDGYISNHAGGIVGGISTGQEIAIRFAVKPTPSISVIQKTIDTSGKSRPITIKGRHDPCIALRIMPVSEAMAALVIMDACLEQQKIVHSAYHEKDT